VRRQVRAYLIAHGTDPDAVDTDSFTDICVMWADGLIGNKSVIEGIGTLTAGVFNYIRAQGQRPFEIKDIIPSVYEYIYPPLTEEEKKRQANDKLLTFMLMNPGAPEMLKGA